MLTIYIKDLVVEARHGVHPEEKEHPQRFIFNVELTLDSDRAGVSDDLADTLDYSELRRKVIDTAQNNSFNLIERLAGEVANQILRDKRVSKVVISIDKPDVYDNGMPAVRLEVTSGVGG
ncbi:MAG TPA: dihydroneopterin aldolase [Candidatus Dormibacteraeota bacterium]|nr:dihydroneopterin aldolase [Candidatus Dormibacteraeota bacterium]